MADKIPEGWKECRLEDIAEVVGGGTPKTDIAEYWNGEIPWITPRDLSNFKGRYISKGERNISEKGLITSSAKILPKGTILLSTRAPVGYLAIAENDITTNQGFRSLVPFNNTDNIFLFYLLKNNVEYLKSQATGTTFGELAGSVLKSLIFPVPPLPEQRAIAEVLSSLDDKIDLLHRENKTLERMAEALFRQWFVEEASDDWEECTLNDLCIEIASGGTPSTKVESYYNGNINWYITKELKDNFLYDSMNKITEDGLKNSAARLFPKETVLVAIYAAPTVGRLGILATEAAFNQATCGLVANKDFCSPEFIYLYLKMQRGDLTLIASGSAQQNLNVGKIKSYPAFIVPKDLMDKFNEIVKPIFKKINSNTRQINILEKLRDILLPKLMSGEVRVTLPEEST